MRVLNYELGNAPLKLTKSLSLLKTDRCIIDVLKGTLALPIMVDAQVVGFFFHGSGKLILDSVIETSRGAVGTPVEERLEKPFIMLREVDEIENTLEAADHSDLLRMGYSNLDVFLEKGAEICKRFFDKHFQNMELKGKEMSVFGFVNSEDKYDILVSKRNHLVYTSKAKVWVFGRENKIMQRTGEIVISEKEKTLVIADGKVLVERTK